MSKGQRITLVTEVLVEVKETEIYCYNCGKQEVWAVVDGRLYGCIACNESWYMTCLDPDQELDTRMIAKKVRKGSMK